MARTIDTGIVTIYDTKKDMKPLECHRIDAKDFLTHKSGRWVASPDGKSKVVDPGAGKETENDTGEAMRIKSLSFNALKAEAKKANIEGYGQMKKVELIDALLAKKDPTAEARAELEAMDLEDLLGLAKKAVEEDAGLPEKWEEAEKADLIEALISAMPKDPA